MSIHIHEDTPYFEFFFFCFFHKKSKKKKPLLNPDPAVACMESTLNNPSVSICQLQRRLTV
jgi:hypothetical protein